MQLFVFLSCVRVLRSEVCRLSKREEIDAIQPQQLGMNVQSLTDIGYQSNFSQQETFGPGALSLRASLTGNKQSRAFTFTISYRDSSVKQGQDIYSGTWSQVGELPPVHQRCTMFPTFRQSSSEDSAVSAAPVACHQSGFYDTVTWGEGRLFFAPLGWRAPLPITGDNYIFNPHSTDIYCKMAFFDKKCSSNLFYSTHK